VSWVKDDNAFKIHKPNDFCETMMKTYFKQSKFKSFTRQVCCMVPNVLHAPIPSYQIS
jgi:hypothetical protein